MRRTLVKLASKPFVKGEVIACGTKYDPIDEEEKEIVDVINSIPLLLVRFESYPRSPEEVIAAELGPELSEKLRKRGYGLTPIEAFSPKTLDVTLVTKIVLDETRYVYCTFPSDSNVRKLARKYGCTVLEEDVGEALVEAPTKYHALRFAVGVLLELNGSAAVGFTQAAATERYAKVETMIRPPFAAFTKMGAEWAIHEGGERKIPKPSGDVEAPDRILYLDVIGSTRLIDKLGRSYLHGFMERVIETLQEEHASILHHRPGGDDVLARFPSKSHALRAAIKVLGLADKAKVKVREGVGNSRSSAAEEALVTERRLRYEASFVAFRFGPDVVALVEPPPPAYEAARLPIELGRMVAASLITGSLAIVHPILALPALFVFPLAAFKRASRPHYGLIWSVIWLGVTAGVISAASGLRSLVIPPGLRELIDVTFRVILKTILSKGTLPGVGWP